MTIYLPDSIFNDPLNYYSIIHFIEYLFIALVKVFSITHIIILSILWELAELFIIFEWARESWANKILDICANSAGFLVGRKLLCIWNLR